MLPISDRQARALLEIFDHDFEEIAYWLTVEGTKLVLLNPFYRPMVKKSPTNGMTAWKHEARKLRDGGAKSSQTFAPSQLTFDKASPSKGLTQTDIKKDFRKVMNVTQAKTFHLKKQADIV